MNQFSSDPGAVELHTYIGCWWKGEGSIVECAFRKKSRVAESSSAPPEECNHIDRLPDELLVEILCRLPCSKSAIRCKSVCRRWRTLISLPDFIIRFASMKMEEERQRFGILFRRRPSPRNREPYKGPPVYRTHAILDLQNPYLRPIPSLGKDEDTTPILSVATCNDLSLYSANHTESRQYDYYIGNINTGQWIQLPSPPFYYGEGVHTAFICDSYYSCGVGESSCKGIVLNDAYRYSIVVVPQRQKSGSEFTSHFLSHKSSKWCERVLSLPRQCRLCARSLSFVFDGMLHFICKTGFIGFDPYLNNEKGFIQCHFVGWPVGFLLDMECVGVSNGHLRISSFNEDGRLGVWLLKDYKAGEWCLQYSITKEDWVLYHPRLTLQAFVIGFHPTNSEVIYLLDSRYIVLCNLKEKTLEVASLVPFVLRNGRTCQMFVSFSMTFPSWPTPLPTLA